MAATLTTANVPVTGLITTWAAATSGGDSVAAPAGNEHLFVYNGGGSSITVTIDVETTNEFGVAQTDNLAVTVAAGKHAIIPITDTRFVNSTTGLVAWTYSAVTSVTVAVVSI